MSMLALALAMADVPVQRIISVMATQASEDDTGGTVRALMAAVLVLGWAAAFAVALLRARQHRRAGQTKRP